tara:strand:+ start:905 stop:1474 length:570 start_codon:yes stop_codon:yes gene_type:complete
MNKVLNTDIINLIYYFVDDYELLHKKKFKVITKQIKLLKNKYILRWNINQINQSTCFNTRNQEFCISKSYRSYFNSDWQDEKKNIKFFNKQYEYKFLRNYLPYCLLTNKQTNEYRMINRDYITIGTKNHSGAGEFLFNDGSTIWNKNKKTNEKNLILYKEKFKKLTKNKKCLNYNYHTFDILDLLIIST